MRDITCKILQNKKDKNSSFFLIDVRKKSEHKAGNLGGKNIPLDQLKNKLNSLAAYRDKEVIVYCKSGKRSQNAKTILENAGFKKVRNLTGGIIKCNLTK